jgi:hypothetical protein
VALRKFVEKLTKPVDELDREQLTDWSDARGGIALDAAPLRTNTRVAGEISSVRIVPRAGADALEVTVSDGRAYATAVFLGRRKIHGLTPGRRIILDGVLTGDDGRNVIYNPVYTLA